jgi:peptide/nickel transport system substrate-binding protein
MHRVAPQGHSSTTSSGRRRSLGAGACALMLAVVLAACGSSGHAATAATKTSKPATTSGKASGSSLVVASNFLPASVDPDPKNPSDAEFASAVSTNLGGQLFSYVGNATDPATAPQVAVPSPELAESASTSANGLTVTVHLRPHVLSQWGDPLTSADVVWTMKRVFNTDLYGAILLKVANINPKDPATATGPLTVAFHLLKPTSVFEQALAVPFLDILDEKAIKSHAVKSDVWGRTWLTTHSASFGPYEIADTDFPSKIIYADNPHYWRGPAQITHATFIVESDDSTRLETLLSGEANFAIGLDSGDLKKIDGESSVKPYIQPNSPLLYYLTFDLKNSQVKSLALRRAVTTAINRQQMVAVAFNGAAKAVTGCLPPNIYPGESTADGEVPAAGSAAAAKSDLKGVSGTHAVTIGYLTSTTTQAMAEIMQQDLTAAGIKATLLPYSSYTVFAAAQAKSKFGIAIDGYGPFLATAGYVFSNLLVSTSGENLGGYDNPAVDVAAAKSMSTTGATQQAALATSCKAMMSDVPVAMLASGDTVSAYGSDISKVSSSGQIPLLYNTRISK